MSVVESDDFVVDPKMPMLDTALVELHDAAAEYAVGVNQAISKQLTNVLYPMAGGALYRIGADTVAFHMAVLTLCADGRVSCSAPLLRTLLDLLLTTAIIVERHDEADLRGFRYSHFFIKTRLSKGDEDGKILRKQVNSGIARLSKMDQHRAREFIFKQRARSYWYAPDYFKNPQDAAKKLFDQELAEYYSILSSAAHGGFFGVGLFRDQPDNVHPNRRDDPNGVALALRTSIRITLLQANMRDEFQLGGQFAGIFMHLFEQVSKYSRPEWK